MEQQSDSIVYQNVLPWRGCEKLYLDERTADVFFVFGSTTENAVKVPAHKNILSSISEKFDAMFYGPSKTDGDIIMDNTPVSPEAFKEFLQFFYLHTVHLTMQHVTEVMDLSKEHMLHDCISACIGLCKEQMTIENLCLSYELALLFEQEDLRKFCEKTIAEIPIEFFQSNGFLLCQRNLLRCILQLDSLKCDESIVFDGCIAWAKAACILKGSDENDAKNLRSELGDLFYEIQFGDMALDQFNARADLYEGLFSMEEFREIIRMIASKDYQSPKFKRNLQNSNFQNYRLLQWDGNLYLCDRIDRTEIGISEFRDYDRTIFTSNRGLYLKEIHFSALFPKSYPTTLCAMKLGEQFGSYIPTAIYCGQHSLSSEHETKIVLPTTVLIKSDVLYGIELRFKAIGDGKGYHNYVKLKPTVEMNDDVLIKFHNVDSYGHISESNTATSGLVTKMCFQLKP